MIAKWFWLPILNGEAIAYKSLTVNGLFVFLIKKRMVFSFPEIVLVSNHSISFMMMSLIFCSEIKGILEHSRINSSPDLKQIKSYVQNGPSEWNANTLFEGVCRFPAAHYAFVPLDDISAFTPKKFWTPTINNSVESYSASKAEAYADEYYSLLKNAVKLRLRSDVPLGCSLRAGSIVPPSHILLMKLG